MKWPINLNKHCSVPKHADEFSQLQCKYYDWVEMGAALLTIS